MPAGAPEAPATSAGGSVQRSVRSGSWEAPKSSAYKGVSWHKHSQKWYAYIQVRAAPPPTCIISVVACSPAVEDTTSATSSMTFHETIVCANSHNAFQLLCLPAGGWQDAGPGLL